MLAQLTRAAVLPLTMIATLVTACGSSGMDDGTDKQGSTCTIALSGAQTGSPSCGDEAAGYLPNENDTAYDFDAGGALPVGVHIKVPGMAATGTFTFDDGVFGDVLVTNGNSKWYAEDNNGGSVSLHVTSLTETDSSAALVSYQAHGTLTATLVPLSGSSATGNVTMTITF